jgi:sterol desaturase/sphingolipid hydroxylase (fatty acid hydroxylase superfamily)
MLNISELANSLEAIDTWFIVIFATLEVGIDLVCHNQRNYQDSIANIAISLVYALTNTVFGYAIAFSGILFFSQFSLRHLEVNLGTMILAVAIADFVYYWEHRAEHRIRLFWAYHNVHHSSTDYNLTVASRLSWVETCFLWVFYIPMALLGFDPLQILIAIQISAVYQTWIHTQKIGKLGILEKIFNTPALHRVHHASNSRYIDKNFGGIVIIWDRLFGTYQPETEVPVYGLTENINTNNPIKINALEYQRIGKYIFKSRDIKDIWHSVFGTPESQPKS